MIIKSNIITNIEIKSVKDLHKLKPFLEEGTLKINKSQILILSTKKADTKICFHKMLLLKYFF